MKKIIVLFAIIFGTGLSMYAQSESVKTTKEAEKVEKVADKENMKKSCNKSKASCCKSKGKATSASEVNTEKGAKAQLVENQNVSKKNDKVAQKKSQELPVFEKRLMVDPTVLKDSPKKVQEN